MLRRQEDEEVDLLAFDDAAKSNDGDEDDREDDGENVQKNSEDEEETFAAIAGGVGDDIDIQMFDEHELVELAIVNLRLIFACEYAFQNVIHLPAKRQDRAEISYRCG